MKRKNVKVPERVKFVIMEQVPATETVTKGLHNAEYSNYLEKKSCIL